MRTTYLLQKNGERVIIKQAIKSAIVKNIMCSVFITESTIFK